MPHESAVVDTMGFMPLDLVDVHVGRTTVKLYPKIGPAMQIWERVHAYQINKTALTNLPTHLKLIIDAFGTQLNASSTMEGIISDFKRYFYDHWMCFQNLTILSFHDSAGTIINDTTSPADPQVLLPVQDGNLANCRSQGVRFVRVQCVLDFGSLVTATPYPISMTLRVNYYIELPQESRAMTNGAGAAYNLVSFLGVNDLRTLTPPEVKTILLDPCLQDGPVLLKASDFNLQNANTDLTDISLDIEQKILKLAWHQLCTSIFAEICPGYSSQPHATLDHIKQSYVDSEGNMVSTPVFAYYQRMMNGMQPFAGKAHFPVRVCNMLMDGIDSRLVLIFRRNYKDYALAHDLQASYQRSKFPTILSAMQMSEDEVKSITAIAQSSVGGQAFHANAMAFPSQAKTTLTRYSGGGGYKSDGGSSAGGYCSDDTRQSLGKDDSCFGCKGIHLWMRDGKIVCPNKDKRGVRDEAKKACQIWHAKYHARRGTQGRSKKRKVDYDRMSVVNKECVKEAVLASMGIKTTANKSPDKSSLDSPSTSKKPLIFIINVPVLSAPSPSCNILPVPIVSNFPHIRLQLGATLDCPDCPILRCVVDTAAALTTENFHFVAALAKKYHHCITKLYAPEDYNPIVLSGIIQHGGESVTMDLTVGFQFHLPYLTRDGQATSILIATGPHVTVNTIIGLPLVQATRMIINLSDNVTDMRALDASPFPLEYRRAAVHVPVVDEAGAVPTHLSTAHQDLIKEIKALEQQFTASSFLANVPNDNAIKHVSFGSRAVGQPMSSTTGNPVSAIRQDSLTGKHGLFDTPMEYYSDPHSLGDMHDNQ